MNSQISKIVSALLFSFFFFLATLTGVVAQGRGEAKHQAPRTVYRYGEFDRAPDRILPTDQVKQYPFSDIQNSNKSTSLGDSPSEPWGCITSAYSAYDTSLTESSYVAAGDLDNDGFDDLVSSSYYDGYIAILHQSTTTHRLELVALWDVTQGGSTNGVRDVYIADMNGDGLKDIVAFDVLNGIAAIFLQTNEYGVFNRIQVQISGANRGAVGDLNQDGHTDLIWAGGNTVNVAYQTATGFTAPQVFSVPDSSGTAMIEESAVGDVNGDGLPDLVAVDSYRLKLYIWESPQMQLRVLNAPNNVSDNVANGDLDKDGIQDIAIPGMGTDQVAVTWGGAFTTTMLSAIGNMNDVAIGDVDDDGNLELIATDQQYYHLVVWDFNGRAITQRIIGANVGPGQVLIADLNGDGLKDVAYGFAGYTVPPHAPVTVHYQTGRIYFPFIVR